jgi:5-methyltetrahydropteroyltriglutamate--homocysteine methyltransferase
VHTCPGGDCDSTHSADVDYAELLPSLFELKAGNFFIALAREPDRPRVLGLIARHLKPGQRAFVGVIDPLDPGGGDTRRSAGPGAGGGPLHSPAPARHHRRLRLCPFSDDTSTSRDTAFAKIAARVRGTALAAAVLAGQSPASQT